MRKVCNIYLISYREICVSMPFLESILANVHFSFSYMFLNKLYLFFFISYAKINFFSSIKGRITKYFLKRDTPLEALPYIRFKLVLFKYNFLSFFFFFCFTIT